MTKEEILQAILDKVSDNADTVDAIYEELNTQGQSTIKGLLLEAERRGANIEERILPALRKELVDIERTILASAILIANPKEPQQAIKRAYSIADKILLDIASGK